MAPIADRTKLAFDAAADSVKQVLTLSTAVLTFTVGFSSDIAKEAVDSDRLWLRIAWLCLGSSVVAGVAALLSLTGALGGGKDGSNKELNIYTRSVRLTSGTQMVLFASGLVLTALFGVFAFSGEKRPPTAPTPICVVVPPAARTCPAP